MVEEDSCVVIATVCGCRKFVIGCDCRRLWLLRIMIGYDCNSL